MSYKPFIDHVASHQHSLGTLEVLYEHDDFMESVGRVADLGCSHQALDLVWWATRTTRDDVPVPLNIQCVGFDLFDSLDSNARQAKVAYQKQDIETLSETQKPFDILWCHDTFQYLIDPIGCLSRWRNIAADGGMLALIVPQTTNMEFNDLAYDLPSGCYYNHTLVSLIQMLAVTGWDCKSGFFLKQPNDPWLHAVVYKSNQAPRDPRKTTWYDLVESKLLPDSADASIQKYGYLRQRDLILPWLDKSLMWLGQQ